MSNVNRQVNTVSRRAFLKATGLSAGGLIIGVTLPVSGLVAGDEANFEPNAFVYMDPKGDTTIFCGRCEMGQGSMTSAPRILARRRYTI